MYLIAEESRGIFLRWCRTINRVAGALFDGNRVASVRIASERDASVMFSFVSFFFLLTISCEMILKPALFYVIFNLVYLPQDIYFSVILEQILLF